jgi:hypothetical protein
LQSETCVDFCGGDAKYPGCYISFQGSWLKDGNSVIETLKGESGPPGRTPTKEELRSLLQELLDEEKAKGFWTKLFLRLHRRS